MLKSSEFNSAVPKFSNGNYASNPLDPANIEEPSAQDYIRGTEPLDTLPAQWWNWLCNQFTSRFNKLNTYVKNIFDELTGFLSLLNISPDGTESAITTGQLKNAFKENYPAYINNKLELGTTYVKKTQKVNNHALSGDITISKADVGLGNVANTGDSANASSGGTTKFTTGGAYNLLSSIAPYFSTSTAYAVGALITYQNRLYECTTAHSAGAWNANHFTARSVQYIISNYILPSLAPAFSTSTSYAVGTFVIYQNKLYRCKATHSAGSWNTSHFELANINNVSADTDGKLALKADLLDLAPAFSNSISYTVGDYVTYNGNMYRCTVAHSAGAWNASDFTLVTVGSDLALKADKTSLAVPSDAVLHYSFDDVPDYPDGTAIYYKNKNWTSVDNWIPYSGNGTISIENGILTSTRTENQLSSFNKGIGIPANSIIKMVLKDVSDTNVSIYRIADGSYYNIKTVTLKANVSQEVILSVSVASQGLMIRNAENVGAGYMQIESIYIGDGSYSTPIIDNANGQFNATNNGEIATKGVSGKGLKCFPNQQVSIGNFQFANNYSVSLWVNPENITSNLQGIILFKGTSFNLRNGTSSTNKPTLVIYPNGVSTVFTILDDLLPLKWSHLVIIKNGTKLTTFLDGVKKTEFTLTSADLTQTDSDLTLNVTSNTRPQSYDDLLIFDRALSDTEVMALYLNKANTPKFYDINNYILDNPDSTPTQDSTNLVTSGGVYTELAKKVDKTTTVNGHALSGNVSVTKGDVGLGSVANTGDSAVPAENGITKFTTGGAYNFFAKKKDYNDWLETVFGWSMGTSWSKASFDNPSFIEYGNGVFVTIGYSGSSYYHFYWSTDGKAWTQGDAADGYLNSCYFNGNLFVAITDLHAYWSTDGKTWTQGSGTSFNMGNSASSVYYANNIWVITGSGRHTYWSTDGKTWTLQNSNLDMYGSVVRYANGLWVIGGNALYWSTDGKTWTQGSGGGRSGSVVYNNGIWVSVGNNPYWSTDGKTWTQGSGFSSSHGLCYGNGIWITLSGSNGYKSTDGKTWTSVSLGGSGGASVSIYFSNGIWVYSSDTTTGGQGVVTRSIDGENWERVTTGLSGSDHDFGRVICKNGIWIVTDAHYDAIYSSSYRSLLPNYGN
jgi:hypothetical protein